MSNGRKHWGKRRNFSYRAISPFPTMFSKDLYGRYVKTRAYLGKSSTDCQLKAYADKSHVNVTENMKFVFQRVLLKPWRCHCAKTLTLSCNISVITEDIDLKFGLCVHYPKSNLYYQGRQFKMHFSQIYSPFSTFYPLSNTPHRVQRIHSSAPPH